MGGSSSNTTLITLMPSLSDIETPEVILEQQRAVEKRSGIMGMLVVKKRPAAAVSTAAYK